MAIFLGSTNPFLAITSNATNVIATDSVPSGEDSQYVMFVPDSTEVLQLSFSMQRKELEFSGLLLEKSENRKILGVIMNDFGVRAFNFTYDMDTESLEISDIASFLDKFYIRSALKGIVRRLFTLKRNELGIKVEHCIGKLSADGSELTLSEPRYDLLITVSRIQNNNIE